MASSPVPTSIDPAVVTIFTGLITAVAGYAAAHIGVRSKAVEKAPEVQDAINKAVVGLVDHYTKALDQEKARHADHMQEMDDKLDRACARIEQLTHAMQAAGIPIPQED